MGLNKEERKKIFNYELRVIDESKKEIEHLISIAKIANNLPDDIKEEDAISYFSKYDSELYKELKKKIEDMESLMHGTYYFIPSRTPFVMEKPEVNWTYLEMKQLWIMNKMFETEMGNVSLNTFIRSFNLDPRKLYKTYKKELKE